MDSASESVNSGGSRTTEKAFRCYHWLQRVLRLLYLLNQCRASEEQAGGKSKADTLFCEAREHPVACSSCDEPNCCETVRELSDQFTENSSPQADAKVPITSNGILGCQLCIDRSDDCLPAEFLCIDCENHFMCSHCIRWHASFFKSHRISELDDDSASWIVDISRRRIPETLCRVHTDVCDRWCFVCDTAHCARCVTRKCVNSCNYASTANKRNLSLEMPKLCSSTDELEKVSANLKQHDKALEQQYQVDCVELMTRKKLAMDALDSVFTETRKFLDDSHAKNKERLKNFHACIEQVIDSSRMLTSRHPLPFNAVLMTQLQVAVSYHLKKAQRFFANGECSLERLAPLSSTENAGEIMKRFIGSTTRHVGFRSTWLRRILRITMASFAIHESLTLVCASLLTLASSFLYLLLFLLVTCDTLKTMIFKNPASSDLDLHLFMLLASHEAFKFLSNAAELHLKRFTSALSNYRKLSSTDATFTLSSASPLSAFAFNFGRFAQWI